MSDDDSVQAFFPGHASLFEMDVALLIQGNWISAVGIGMFSSPSFGTESVIVPVPGIPSWALARLLGIARWPLGLSPKSFRAFSISAGCNSTEAVSARG